LTDRPATNSPIRLAESNSFFSARSGDLVIVPKPYWLGVSSRTGKPRDNGTGHGTPYYYDQRVPILLMGGGIQRVNILAQPRRQILHRRWQRFAE